MGIHHYYLARILKLPSSMNDIFIPTRKRHSNLFTCYTKENEPLNICWSLKKNAITLQNNALYQCCRFVSYVQGTQCIKWTAKHNILNELGIQLAEEILDANRSLQVFLAQALTCNGKSVSSPNKHILTYSQHLVSQQIDFEWNILGLVIYFLPIYLIPPTYLGDDLV